MGNFQGTYTFLNFSISFPIYTIKFDELGIIDNFIKQVYELFKKNKAHKKLVFQKLVGDTLRIC